MRREVFFFNTLKRCLDVLYYWLKDVFSQVIDKALLRSNCIWLVSLLPSPRSRRSFSSYKQEAGVAVPIIVRGMLFVTHLSWLVIGWKPAPGGLKKWGERRRHAVQDFIAVFHGTHGASFHAFTWAHRLPIREGWVSNDKLQGAHSKGGKPLFLDFFSPGLSRAEHVSLCAAIKENQRKCSTIKVLHHLPPIGIYLPIGPSEKNVRNWWTLPPAHLTKLYILRCSPTTRTLNIIVRSACDAGRMCTNLTFFPPITWVCSTFPKRAFGYSQYWSPLMDMLKKLWVLVSWKGKKKKSRMV